MAEKTLVCHVSREILRYSTFFTKYSGVLSAVVRKGISGEVLYRKMDLKYLQAESNEKIFSQVKNVVEGYYLEPEKIPINYEYWEAYGDFKCK